MHLLKSISLAVVIGCAVVTATSAHAALITFKYEGTISAGGYDYSGIWGPANSSLAGLPISVIYYADTDKGSYFFSQISRTTTEYVYGDGTTGPVLSSSIVIGSTTVTWAPNYFSRVFAEQVTPDPVFLPNGFGSISQSSDTHNGTNWTQLFSTISLLNTSLPFGVNSLGSAVLDPITISGTNGHASAWHYDDPNGPAIYDWDVPYDFISYSITATEPVPEPITLSFFGAGIAGIVAMRRRKRAPK